MTPLKKRVFWVRILDPFWILKARFLDSNTCYRVTTYSLISITVLSTNARYGRCERFIIEQFRQLLYSTGRDFSRSFFTIQSKIWKEFFQIKQPVLNKTVPLIIRGPYYVRDTGSSSVLKCKHLHFSNGMGTVTRQKRKKNYKYITGDN